MANPDTKSLLNQIILLLDSHDQSIKDSGVLIDSIEYSLQAKTFVCNYKPGKDDIRTGLPKRNVSDLLENLSNEEKIYRALVMQMKEIINSPDQTITATESGSELVKILVDKFLSITDNPRNVPDYKIMEFVKSQEAEIMKFIEKDCKGKILLCLAEKVQEEKSRNNLMYVSTITSGPTVKATSRLESYNEEVLPVMQFRPPEERNVTAAAHPQLSQSQKESNLLSKYDFENDLQRCLEMLNTKVQAQYTDIVIDQINGLDTISKTITADQRVSEVFSLITTKYSEDQKLNLKTLKGYSEQFQNFNSKLVSKRILCQERGKNNDQSTLAKALDEAILGLEQDIRAKLCDKSRLNHSSKISMLETLTLNSNK